MSYSIMSHYLIRSPLLPIERRNKVKGASSFEGKVAFLEDVLDDEVFVEAIEWGSRHYIVKCANFVIVRLFQNFRAATNGNTFYSINYRIWHLGQ